MFFSSLSKYLLPPVINTSPSSSLSANITCHLGSIPRLGLIRQLRQPMIPHSYHPWSSGEGVLEHASACMIRILHPRSSGRHVSTDPSTVSGRCSNALCSPSKQGGAPKTAPTVHSPLATTLQFLLPRCCQTTQSWKQLGRCVEGASHRLTTALHSHSFMNVHLQLLLVPHAVSAFQKHARYHLQSLSMRTLDTMPVNFTSSGLTAKAAEFTHLHMADMEEGGPLWGRLKRMAARGSAWEQRGGTPRDGKLSSNIFSTTFQPSGQVRTLERVGEKRQKNESCHSRCAPAVTKRSSHPSGYIYISSSAYPALGASAPPPSLAYNHFSQINICLSHLPHVNA